LQHRASERAVGEHEAGGFRGGLGDRAVEPGGVVVAVHAAVVALIVQGVVEAGGRVGLAVVHVQRREEDAARVARREAERHRMDLGGAGGRSQLEHREAEVVDRELRPDRGGQAEARVEAIEVVDGRHERGLERADVAHDQRRAAAREVGEGEAAALGRGHHRRAEGLVQQVEQVFGAGQVDELHVGLVGAGADGQRQDHGDVGAGAQVHRVGDELVVTVEAGVDLGLADAHGAGEQGRDQRGRRGEGEAAHIFNQTSRAGRAAWVRWPTSGGT
jgi:hypothetical protein